MPARPDASLLPLDADADDDGASDAAADEEEEEDDDEDDDDDEDADEGDDGWAEAVTAQEVIGPNNSTTNTTQ